ncbi:MAG: hypothetical protein ACT452_17855 [Microthrixaceae bacterium]
MHDDLGPGLHVLREDEPLHLAGSIAVDLQADLCATLPQADALIEVRAALPLLDAPALEEARLLASRLGRAERIAQRTRDRAVIEVGQRLASASGGLAVHPSTIRDRAAALEAARARVAAAEAALADHANHETTIGDRAEAEAALAAEQAEQAHQLRAADHEVQVQGARQRRRLRSLGIVVVAIGLGDVLYLAGAPVAVVPVPLVVGLLWALRDLRPRSGDADDDLQARAEASSLLSQVAASTNEVFNARRAQFELDEHITLLETQRDRALEDRRVAERAWRELAGDGVDVDQLDDVIRRHDPQHEDARLLARETVGVRTAEAVLRQVEEQWRAFWEARGLEVPDPAAQEESVDELLHRMGRAAVLVGPATARGDDLARVAPAATIVVLTDAVEAPDGAR